MAKKKSEAESNEINAVDLISLLSTPETTDSYELELSVPEQDIDLIALGKEELREEAERLAKAKAILPNKEARPITTQSSMLPFSSPLPPSPYTLHPSSITPTRTTTITPIIPTTPTQTVSKTRLVSNKPINRLDVLHGIFAHKGAFPQEWGVLITAYP